MDSTPSQKRCLNPDDEPEAKRLHVEVKYLPHFLRLPPELRLQIYGHLLPDVDVVPTERRKYGCPRNMRKDGQKSYPALMRVSKLINAETTGMVYATCAIQISIAVCETSYVNGKSLRCMEEDDVLTPFLQRFELIHINLFMPRELHPEKRRIEVDGYEEANWRSFNNPVNYLVWHLQRYWTTRKSLQVNFYYCKLHYSEREKGLKLALRPFENLRSIQCVHFGPTVAPGRSL